jgi:hypothetical protein
MKNSFQPSAFSPLFPALGSLRADRESLWPGCGSGNHPGSRQMKLKADG